jgi:hypothetical protein
MGPLANSTNFYQFLTISFRDRNRRNMSNTVRITLISKPDKVITRKGNCNLGGRQENAVQGQSGQLVDAISKGGQNWRYGSSGTVPAQQV